MEETYIVSWYHQLDDDNETYFEEPFLITANNPVDAYNMAKEAILAYVKEKYYKQEPEEFDPSNVFYEDNGEEGHKYQIRKLNSLKTISK